MEEEELLTYEQVSQLLNVPIATVYGLVSQKRIPHIRLGSRFVRFSKQQILAWLETRKAEVIDEN